LPVTAVAAGAERGLLLDAAGRAWLADFTSTVAAPVEVSGGYPRLRSVAAGLSHWLTVDADGRLWAWGEGLDGKLGVGVDTDRDTPAAVTVPSALRLPVAAVAAGQTHSLALDAAGRIWAWGGNAFGQLGAGGTTDSTIPVPVR
jgi:alpha-tubulin suppressor-like RCC1 family protein